MEKTKEIETLFADIEKGKVILTPGQKEQLRKGMHRPVYNDIWDKMKSEFYDNFKAFNYTNKQNKQIVCSLSLQEAIGTLLKIKYKVDSVRKLPANETQLKEDVRQILKAIER